MVDGKNVINGNTGAIASATVTDGGKGYARYGRESPTLTLSNKSDVAATTTVTLSAQEDDCGLDYWSVQSISITDGGRGYVDGQTLSISLGEGDSVQAAAAGTIKAIRAEPSLVASPADGSSENLIVTLSKTSAAPPMWEVSSVEVSESLGGYVEGQSVEFSGDGVTVVANAVAYVRTNRSEPAITLAIDSAGSGAILTPTLSKVNTEPFEGQTPVALYAWTVDSISISDGGSGYSEGDKITAIIDDGQEIDNKLPGVGGGPFWGEVSKVDGVGAITGVSKISGGYYFKADDVAIRVDLWSGGEYYVGGVLESVAISDGGKYYHENPDLSPYVAEVNVSISQGYAPPGIPDGGQNGTTIITATVDDDTSSATFGEVVSLEVQEGGQNWLGWYWVYGCDCSWIYGEGEGSDYSVVCYRGWDGNGGPTCEYAGFRCWDGEECNYGPLLQLRATSSLKTEVFGSAFAEAPCGIPGVQGGPITGVWGGPALGPAFSQGWAIYGRVSVAADKLTAREYPANATPENDISATCSMVEESHDGYAKYWRVDSVSISSPISGTGIYDGQQVALYSSEYPTVEDVTAKEEEDGLDVNQNSPPARTMAAYGTAEVDVDGNLTAVVITNGGVFYRRVHSTEVAAISPPVTVSIIQHKPSSGSGAAMSATINVDTSSPEFGMIGIDVSSGGEGYLSYASGAGGAVGVQYFGPDQYPTVTASCGGPQESIPPGAEKQTFVTYTATTKVSDCGDFSFEAKNGDSTVSVSPGGTAAFIGSNKCCAGCYVCCEDEPSQVVITLSRSASSGTGLKYGTAPLPLTFDAPVLELCPQSLGGIGAELTANLEQIQVDSDVAYTVASVTIANSGSGFSVGESINVRIIDGLDRGEAAITVASVDADGGITAVNIDDGGVYYNAEIGEANECSIECDADDAELVFDLMQLMSDEECGIEVSRTANTTPGDGAVCHVVSESVAVQVRLGIFASDGTTQYRTCTQNYSGGTGGRMGLIVSQTWTGSAGSFVGGATSDHVFTYRSDDISAQCGDYANWEKNGERKNAYGVNGRLVGIGDMYAHGEVPLFTVDPNNIPSYSAYRVCPDYEVTIDFQA